MFTVDDVLQIEIHGLGSSGEGVGTVCGMRFFVDGALPGELVEAKIATVKKTYAKASIIKIIRPSKDRVKAPCPIFGKCGGCQIQHLRYSAQLEVKKQKVIDALQRIGNFKHVQVEPCIGSPLQYGYRNKIQMPVVYTKDGILIGLYRKQSHEIIPVEKCAIHCTIGEEAFSFICRKIDAVDDQIRYILLKSSFHIPAVLVTFVTPKKASPSLLRFAEELCTMSQPIKGVVQNINSKPNNVILGKQFIPLHGQTSIDEEIGGLSFSISSASFFQVNPMQAEMLYQEVIRLAQLDKKTTLIDCYCGVGTMALLAAMKAKWVYGIESVCKAIEDARKNARCNNIENATFYAGNTEDFLHKLPKADVIFLNPPRKGCSTTVIDHVIRKKPLRIIYISCDPATLARDLEQLCSRGYCLEKVQPFDMFPQTSHVETVVSLIYNNC